MSAYEQGPPGPQGQPRGPEPPFLTAEERKIRDRMLSAPEEFPRKFGSWIADYIAVNGLEIPASQVRGFNQFRPRVARNGSVVSIGGTTYVTAAGGPRLDDLGKGTWFFLYGFQFATNEGNNPGYGLISPSINEETPSDGNAVRTKNMLGSDAPSVSTEDRTNGSAMYFMTTELTEEKNNVELQYRVTDGSMTAENVYLIGIKIGN